jgi:mannose-6-phosphate isomerase-like protein (cupin superfamily)
MPPRKINLETAFAAIDELWSPRIVAGVNEVEVKLARVEGEFEWHRHPEADELFLVVEGRLRVEFRDGDVHLEQGELLVVPRNTEHRPVAPEETRILMVEPKGTLNTGDAGGVRTVEARWL